ncbi:MAG: hypothetical protein HYU63_04520 [Armatimonadetes bacterium]|nr:hypothetical protein [Armatimonadota bacterium]
MKKIFLLSLILFLSAIIYAHEKHDIFYKKGVVFKHSTHTLKNKISCNICHSKIFKKKAYGTKFKMADLYQGKYCAVCHNGKKAFAVKNCQRCHKK